MEFVGAISTIIACRRGLRLLQFQKIINAYKLIIKNSQNNKNNLDRRTRDTYNRDTKDKQNVRKWETKKVDIIFGKS